MCFFLFISFGLTNALTRLIYLMNRVFKPYIDIFSIIFIDEIYIFFWKEEDHVCYLIIVFQTLEKSGLYAKFFKDFSNMFLGHINYCEGIRVENQKIKEM